VLLLLALLSAPAVLAQAVISDGLLAELDALGPAETTTVVVTFDGEGPLTTAQRQALLSLGIARGITMQSLPIAGVLATPAQVAGLQNTPGVRSLWDNHAVELYNADATELTGVNAVRTDDQFRQMNGGLPVSGKGVGVVVHDSGIDGTHPDLQLGRNLVQNVLGSQNLSSFTSLMPITYLEDQPNTDTNSGHGTHVAGTVGGTGAASGGLHEGVAPGADLIGYGSGGVLLVLDVVGGFDYTITNQFRYGIRIITNSWGGAGAFDPRHPVNEASYRTYQRGIAVFFAAGNDGPNASTHSRYSKAPWVMSVAAGNKDGETLAGFSSRGTAGESETIQTYDGKTWTRVDEPSITAPGVGIISACSTGSPLCALGVQADNVRYTSMQGTSMATPHVAGIAALMFEANPMLTPDDVYGILRDTATPLDYEAWEAGAGYVNAYASVAAAFGLDPTPYLKTLDGDDTQLPAGVMLVDETGDHGAEGTDITRVTLFEEDAATVQVALEVADLDLATPSTMLAQGLQVGAMQDYSVEFDLLKADGATVRYTLSAKRTLVAAGTDGVALDAPSFDYGVRAADGAGRGMGDLPGIWDAEAGTITWIVPTSLLTVAAPPADLTADIDDTGRPAAAGDVLAAFSADVATAVWGGVVGITPGQTNYDSASGTARHTLGEEGSGTTPGDDDDDEETPPGQDPKAWKNVRPTLACVVDHEDGTFTARFGVRNDNATATTIAVGVRNFFFPFPADRGQPTAFAAGTEEVVFEADSEAKFLIWKLGRRTAVASLRAERCPDPDPQVVVSVIDSGINPYHAFYHAGSEIYADAAPSAVTAEVREQFGIDETHTLRLTRTGDFAADFAADAALWASVVPGEVYWVEGTNILAASFDAGSRIILPDDEDDTHGVGTSAAVLRANPEAVVLFLEGVTDEAETFAFTHPSVDVVSTSYGPVGSLPLPYHINNSYLGVVENGKLHVGAADNSPSTAIQDGTAGPWWSIGVAGFEEGDSEGKQLLSGSLPDVVGDFYQTLPYCAECEDGQRGVGGTSFATPRTAGTLSAVILEARREAGHLGGIAEVDGQNVMAAGNGLSITNWEVRRAMEEAAYIPTLDEYDPQAAAFDLLGLPVPPAGAYALVGWGAVTPDPEHAVIPEMLAQLGIGGAPTRSKSFDTCEFMATVVDARALYWNTVAIESESYMIGGTDDYIYCNAPDASQAMSTPAMASVEAEALTLGVPYPNPVRAQATVAFELPESGAVRLAVYDLLGREAAVLAEGVQPAGAHTARVDASRLASGVYLVRLDAAGQTLTHQLTVVR